MAGQNEYKQADPLDGTEDIAVWQHGVTRTATTSQLVALVPRVATDVGAFLLLGLTTATNAVITATDTIVSAFGKLQAQITSEVARARASEGALTAQISTQVAAEAARAIAAEGSLAPKANPAFTGTPTGDFSAGSVLTTSTTTARTMALRGADVINLKDYGGTGNGTTNDSAAVAAASAAGPVYAPSGTYLITTPNPVGLFYGRGQIKDTGGKRAPYTTILTAAPSLLGAPEFVTTAFNGDLSHVQFPIEHRITGAATLTQPTSGYKITPETACAYEYFLNTSGWNQSTTSPDGRTAGIFRYQAGFQGGQGDLMMNYVTVYVTGQKSSTASWLSNPAGCAFCAQIGAGNDGVYLQGLGDIDLQDNGFAVSGMGLVLNLHRTNAGQTIGQTWSALRSQSIGTVSIDSHLSVLGLAYIGADLVGGDYGANKGAITVKASDRIYLNATNGTSSKFSNATLLGQEWLEYDAGTASIRLVTGNTVRLSAAAAGATAYGTLTTLPASGSGNSVQLVPAATGSQAIVQPFDLGSANASLLVRGLGTGGLQLSDAGGRVGFYGFAPQAKLAVTGSKGGNAALGNLLSQLAALGLITDSTT